MRSRSQFAEPAVDPCLKKWLVREYPDINWDTLTETLDLLVAVALAAVDVLVAVAAVVVVTALLVADVASVEDTAALLVAWTAPAAAPESPHEPKPDWHPSPQ